MAIWQFKFNFVPRLSVQRVLGASAAVIAEYAQIDPNTYDSDPERALPNYWLEKSPKLYAEFIARHLAPRPSWSEDALMFGSTEGDSIELWTDSFFVELDIRNYNQVLAQFLMEMASKDDLWVAENQQGRLFSPEQALLESEIQKSPAAKFTANPIQTIIEIGRRFE